MYKIIYDYGNGRKGTCLINGKPVQYPTYEEAIAHASDLNKIVAEADEEARELLPTYCVEKVEEKKINVGDRVVVQSAKYGPDIVGRTGKVIAIDENEPNGPYYIDGPAFLLHFFENELRKEGAQ